MLTRIMAIALAMGITVAPAGAATVLIFAESGVNVPAAVKITDNGNGTTTLATDIGVTITSILGPLGPDLPITDARFILSGHSTDFASVASLAGVNYLLQKFTGSFEVVGPGMRHRLPRGHLHRSRVWRFGRTCAYHCPPAHRR